MEVLGDFGFGPVKVDIIKVREFLKTLDNITFDGLEFVVGVGLHEGGNEPKVEFFLFVFVLDVGNDLFEVNTCLGVLFLF